MGSSSQILLKREPKSNSFFLSFLGYAFLLLLAIVISNKNSDSKPEYSLTKQDKKVLIRENKPQFSIARFSSGLPNTPLILGIYQSGNDAFYHQFKGLAENYSMTKNVNFAMINLKVIEEMNILDELRVKKIIQNLISQNYEFFL